MFGSEILDVAVGMVFVFALVSILCSAIREALETKLKTRAAYLERGIRELLHDPDGSDLARSFYEHPLIYSLFPTRYAPPTERAAPRSGWFRLPSSTWLSSQGEPPVFARVGGLPSYIPARNFAVALMDMAARGRDTSLAASSAGEGALTLAAMRANIGNLRNPPVQRALLAATDLARDDLELATRQVQDWYDSAMDRVSGWYKRSTQVLLFWIGLGVAAVLNVDALAIAQHLYRDDAARAAMVAHAQAAINDTGFLHRSYEQARRDLGTFPLPIGWSGMRIMNPLTTDVDVWPDVLRPVLGWMVTAFAATLGAPFWFDLLNKLMVIRSTVKPREKSPEEGSEDRQRGTDRPGDGRKDERTDRPADRRPSDPGSAPASGGTPAAPADVATDEEERDACGGHADDPVTPDAALPPARGGVA